MQATRRTWAERRLHRFMHEGDPGGPDRPAMNAYIGRLSLSWVVVSALCVVTSAFSRRWGIVLAAVAIGVAVITQSCWSQLVRGRIFTALYTGRPLDTIPRDRKGRDEIGEQEFRARWGPMAINARAPAVVRRIPWVLVVTGLAMLPLFGAPLWLVVGVVALMVTAGILVGRRSLAARAAEWRRRVAELGLDPYTPEPATPDLVTYEGWCRSHHLQPHPYRGSPMT